MSFSEFKPELLYQYLTDETTIEELADDVVLPISSELRTSSDSFSNKELHAIGGMKKIYKVRDLRTGRSIAMAEMKKDGECSNEETEQFLREARITAALEHPNIVPVYDIGLNSSNRPFFTMKFMRSHSLKQIIRELVKANPIYVEKFSLNSLLDIFLKICDAIAFAHSNRVVHLDLKPGNVIIGEYGEVYICDWGLAKILDTTWEETLQIAPLDETILNDITLSGMIKGTPGFMAPEQIDKMYGKKCESTDIYSLGALLYTILIFKRPFSGLNAEMTMQATLKGSILPPEKVTYKEIPTSLSAICMKAMSTQQTDRYSTVDELAKEIRAYQEGFATEAENATPLKYATLLIKRNKLFSFMLVCVLATITIFVAVMKKSEIDAVKELKLHTAMHTNSLKILQDERKQVENRLKKVAESYKERLEKEVQNNKDFIIKYHPTTININFTDGGSGIPSSSKNLAGVFERGFWENVYKEKGIGTTHASKLRNSKGWQTTVSYYLDYIGKVSGSYSMKTNGFNKKTAKSNNSLMTNWLLFEKSGSIVFTGLSSFASLYEVIIYSTKARENYAKFSIGDRSLFTKSNSDQRGPFIESTYKTIQEAEEGGVTNFARFYDLSGDMLTIDIEAVNGWAPICGIQIIQKKLPKSDTN